VDSVVHLPLLVSCHDLGSLYLTTPLPFALFFEPILSSVPVGFLSVSRCCHLKTGLRQKSASILPGPDPTAQSPKFGIDP
jgi:hypothetical protein